MSLVITAREKLDEVLELLHNSWLEDDYNLSDPDAIEAKEALMALIAEVIGPDVEYDPDRLSSPQVEAINWVKSNQRKRAGI